MSFREKISLVRIEGRRACGCEPNAHKKKPKQDKTKAVLIPFGRRTGALLESKSSTTHLFSQKYRNVDYVQLNITLYSLPV